LHAVTDALLGAAGLGDIGDAYPDSDAAHRGRDSAFFVCDTLGRLKQAGWQVVNIDVVIFAQEPKLGAAKETIRHRLAKLLEVNDDAVNVKAKTGEHAGSVGRGEVIACQAVALLRTRE
jgi:2-C-methyl-D-erythritol 2,4-cyclodiphosphate synthase